MNLYKPNMRKLLLLFVSFLILHAYSFAQNTKVKGTVADTADHKSLQNTVIALLEKKDTTLVQFTRADSKGNFEITAPDSIGNYILMVTHPYFANFLDSITLNKGHVLDMGIINMLSKIKMMEEVVVRGNRAVYIKGDTTVFTADSFKVAEGANVEELLRKLPGFQVDRNGKIKAQGEDVKKVLVDGEEFFGSDPGIATKNLRADVVNEVQVYDRKSDQATFTGIDDGVRDKTVNLKLKEDKKKGYFGKIDAGAGFRDMTKTSDNKSAGRYYGAGMINAFQGKRKMAAYGISSNTGWMNLDWEDNEKYGGGGNMEIGDGFISITNNDYNSSNGIPTNYNGGLHYSNKFGKKDMNSVNAGYKYVRIDAPANTKVFSKNFTPDSSWTMNSTNDNFSMSQKHSVNFTFESKLDSMNTLKLTTSGNLNYSKTNYVYNAENINDKNGYLINKNNRKGNSDVYRSAYNADLLWMHKFKKEFRTLSISSSFNHNNSNSDGYLYSKIDFYKNNTVDSSNIIDQRNLITNNSNSISSKIAYTEPIVKDFYMETSYAVVYNKRNNIREILAKSATGYNNRIDSLSNEYEYNDISNSPGLSFRLTKKKVNASFGSTVGFTNYEQLNKTLNTKREYSFTNYYPRANFSYKIKPQSGIWFSYNGRSSAPNLDQLQPIKVNTDPLNIYIGNPDLKPSFSHSFSLSYNSWKMLSERSIYIGINGGFTQNSFATLNYIKNAVRTTQTVNTNGVNYFSLYTWYNKKLKKANIDFGLSPNISFNNYVDFIADNKGNALKNITKNTGYMFRFSIGRDVEKKYRINLEPYFGYNIAKGTVNKIASAEYWSSGVDFRSTVYLPKKFEINNTVDAEFRQKDKRFPTNNNFVFWNADIQKKLFKDKFIIKLSVNDILNQKNGYRRNFGSSSFTETYNTVLRRHYLIGFIWNFTKMNSGATPQPNGN